MTSKLRKKAHDELPATVGLVKEVRKELKAEIRSLDKKIDAVHASLESKISSVESKISSVESKISSMDSRISSVESKIEQVLVAVHGTQVLMEEQRGENRIVLDGLKTVLDRMDRLENRPGAF